MDILKIKIDQRLSNQSINNFLKSFNVAKSKIYLLEHHKKIQINDVFHRFDYLLKDSDIMSVDLELFESIDFVPEYEPIDIIFEDEDILIINKPAGIIIYPTEKTGVGTLVNRIAGYYHQKGLNRQVRYLHRLDTDTTGCFLIAKHFLVHAYLANHWDHSEIVRKYLALISGQLSQDNGIVSEAIGKDRHNNNRYRVKNDINKAITMYQVIDKFPQYSLLRLELETGKTHQIRVHMSFLGHPLLGDRLYGGRTDLILRPALHSETIEFINPITGLKCSVTARLPEDFRRLI